MYMFSLIFFLSSFVGMQTSIWQEKNWALLIDLLKEKKNNILHYFFHSEKNVRQMKRVKECNGNSYIK